VCLCTAILPRAGGSTDQGYVRGLILERTSGLEDQAGTPADQIEFRRASHRRDRTAAMSPARSSLSRRWLMEPGVTIADLRSPPAAEVIALGLRPSSSGGISGTDSPDKRDARLRWQSDESASQASVRGYRNSPIARTTASGASAGTKCPTSGSTRLTDRGKARSNPSR